MFEIRPETKEAALAVMKEHIPEATEAQLDAAFEAAVAAVKAQFGM
jgi:hypothetical protein